MKVHNLIPLLFIFAMGITACGHGGGGDGKQDQDASETAVTVRVSITSDGSQVRTGGSFTPDLSSDGRYVAFASQATDLVTGVPTNGLRQIYVHDRDVDEDSIYDEPGAIRTIIVTVNSSGDRGGDRDSYTPSITQGGRYIAFASEATDLLTGVTTNGLRQIYVHDRDIDEDSVYDEPGAIGTILVSVNSNGDRGNRDSFIPSITSDGRYVAFESLATNLIPIDENGIKDVFVHDRDADENGQFDEAGAIETILVSLDSDGNQGNNVSGSPSISSDGRYVAFESTATNLADSATNGLRHIFVHDRDPDEDGNFDELFNSDTSLISSDSIGNEGNNNSFAPAISNDGKYVAFESLAGNLVSDDTNSLRDIFVRGPQ